MKEFHIEIQASDEESAIKAMGEILRLMKAGYLAISADNEDGSTYSFVTEGAYE